MKPFKDFKKKFIKFEKLTKFQDIFTKKLVLNSFFKVLPKGVSK